MKTSIANNLNSTSFFKFQADGEVKDIIGNKTYTQSPPVIFQGSMAFNPSSSKAKTYAILTAILTCPNQSDITFHTDLQNVIDTFHKITNYLLSTRQLLKIKSYNAWMLINR
jgi:hypothetical protein